MKFQSGLINNPNHRANFGLSRKCPKLFLWSQQNLGHQLLPKWFYNLFQTV